MLKIILDAGHGGTDPGAVSQGRQEKDDNLELTMAVGKILRQKGIDVEFTRTEDLFQTPFEKAQIANNKEADYFISFHRNSSAKENQYNGAEVLVYNKNGKKLELAENIVEGLGRAGFREIGVKERPGLVVLRKTRMPAILIETGFINNTEDNRIFDEKFNEIAMEIADAVLKTVGEIETEENTEERFYRIQVGAYRNRQYADRMLYRLQEQGFPAYLIWTDGYFKVQVGAYQEFGNAIAMEKKLRQRGYPTLLIV